MRILEIIRLEESEDGTIGVLKLDKRVFCFTLEPQDRLNRPFMSSIPAQQYLCRRFNSPRFGETFYVENVPGRSGIEFHPLNIVVETEGCIGIGEKIGKLRGIRAIKNSGNTFAKLMHELKGEDVCHLTIREVY